MHIAKCWPPLLYTTLSDAEKLPGRMAASSGASARTGAPPLAGGDMDIRGPFLASKILFDGGGERASAAPTEPGTANRVHSLTHSPPSPTRL
jgi:hypothetical protein